MRLHAPGFRLGAASAVAFSQSGKFLAQIGRRVLVYDVAARKSIASSQWHSPHPSVATFAPSDDWVAIRSTTGAIVAMDPASGQPLSRLRPAGDVADDAEMIAGPESDSVVEACVSGTLRVRRVNDLAIEYAEQHPAYMLGPLSCSATRDRWAIAFNRRQLDAPEQPDCHVEIRTWPLRAPQQTIILDSLGIVYHLALSPDGYRLALFERSRTGTKPVEAIISVLELSTGEVVARVTGVQWKPHAGFAWSPDGRWLVVGTHEGHQLLDSHLNVVGSMLGEYSSDAAFSPDGQLLALGYWGHGLVIPVEHIKEWFPQASSTFDQRAV